MNARAAHPEHFFAAVEHALDLLEAGAGRRLIASMGRACAARGLTDAAAGYEHVVLMLFR
jgi:hypothetical protein